MGGQCFDFFGTFGRSWALEIGGGHGQPVQEHQVDPGLPPGHPSSMGIVPDVQVVGQVIHELKVRPQEQSGEVWMPLRWVAW